MEARVGGAVLEDVPAGEVGHHEVEDHQIEVVGARDVEHLASVSRLGDDVAIDRELVRHQLPHRIVVLGDENPLPVAAGVRVPVVDVAERHLQHDLGRRRPGELREKLAVRLRPCSRALDHEHADRRIAKDDRSGQNRLIAACPRPVAKVVAGERGAADEAAMFLIEADSPGGGA